MYVRKQPRTQSGERKIRVSVSIPDNVMGCMEAALEECYEQVKRSGNKGWIELAEQLRPLCEFAFQLGGPAKDPIPRGRAAAIKREEEEDKEPPRHVRRA